jgi:1-acyl-sn-glycerol-3-phosphate acyltransferase
MRLLKEGMVVGIYPEGIRSWDGLAYPLRPAIAGLIQKRQVTVVCCRLEGAYLCLPRWANKYRRLPVRIVFQRLYEPDTIPSDRNKIADEISSFLRSREYELTYDERRYRSKGLANNITTLLYRCPNCQCVEGLKVVQPLKTNRIQCASCSSTWRITLNGRMLPLDESYKQLSAGMTWAECYRKIKAMPLYPIRTNRPLELQQDEELYIASGPMMLNAALLFPEVQEIGEGQMYLTNRRFLFLGADRQASLDAPLGEIDQVSTDPGGQFYFTYSGNRYLIVIKTESILKWSDTLLRLKSRLAEQEEKADD